MVFALVALAVSLMIPIAGLAAIRKRLRLVAWTAGLVGACLVAWSAHYHEYLSGIPELSGDRAWHLIYTRGILIGMPVALLLLGVVGYRSRMREYRAAYKAYEKP